MVLGRVSPRVLASQCFSSLTGTRIGSSLRVGSSSSCGSSMASDSRIGDDGVSEREWQGWGTSSPLPELVAEVVGDLRSLEKDSDEQMTFGGLGGKLQGDFKVKEDKKHRAVYQALTDSEMKLEFFSARQVACRLLGSRGYLCQKRFLEFKDMKAFVSKIKRRGILYNGALGAKIDNLEFLRRRIYKIPSSLPVE